MNDSTSFLSISTVFYIKKHRLYNSLNLLYLEVAGENCGMQLPNRDALKQISRRARNKL